MIKRFEPSVNGDYPGMEEGEDGGWIRHADHAAELEALRADRDSWEEQASDRTKDWDKMRAERNMFLDALIEIKEQCQNSGRWSPVIIERMLERIEDAADLALEAAKGSNTDAPVSLEENAATD